MCEGKLHPHNLPTRQKGRWISGHTPPPMKTFIKKVYTYTQVQHSSENLLCKHDVPGLLHVSMLAYTKGPLGEEVEILQSLQSVLFQVRQPQILLLHHGWVWTILRSSSRHELTEPQYRPR